MAREAAQRDREEMRRAEEQEKDRQHQLQMKLLEEKIATATAKAEAERAQEQRLAREEDRKYKEKKDLQDAIDKAAKAIPKPPPMRDNEDLQDYLDMFKITQTKRLIAKKQWPSHLTPNLLPRFRTVVTRLSVEDQDDFDKIEAALLKSASLSPQMNVKRWWELQRDPTMEHTVWASQLRKGLRRLYPNGDPATLEELLCLEKLLRTYPSDLRQKIRDFNPSTVDEAVDLLHRFDPYPTNSKKAQPAKETSFKPGAGSWKPRWKEQNWGKPSSDSGCKPGTGERTADNTQVIPAQDSDASKTTKEVVKEENEEDSKFYRGSRKLHKTDKNEEVLSSYSL